MMAHDASARPRDMSTVRDRLLRIFPEIDGGRMPMRSLTEDAFALDATLPADASEQARALVEAARAALPQSGVASIPQPVSQGSPRGALPSSPRMSAHEAVSGTFEDDDVSDVAGVPKKRRGSAMVIVVGVVAVAMGLGGAAAFVKMKTSAPSAPPGGYGLVQSTVATTPAPTAPLPTLAAAPAATVPAVSAPEVTTPPAPAATKPATSSKGSHASAPSKPAKGASSDKAEKPAAADKDNADRPVGGTGVSDQF